MIAAFDYQRARQTADRLLTKFGQSATLRQTSTTGGVPWDPGSGTTTTTDTTVTLAVTDYTVAEIDGTLIQAGDRRAYISAEGTVAAPALTDTLIVGGINYSVVAVKPLNPGGTVVMWEVQARA
jgi:hypothetical protein